MISLHLFFSETIKLSVIVVLPFCISIKCKTCNKIMNVPIVFHPHWLLYVLYLQHLRRYVVVVLHRCFTLQSLMTCNVEHLFRCLFSFYTSSLPKVFTEFLCGAVFLLVKFKSLHIFWITVVFQMCHLQIFYSRLWLVLVSWHSLLQNRNYTALIFQEQVLV